MDHWPSLPSPLTLHSPWALQTEKELDPDGLKKESERDRALLALTSTLNKLIKRLEEKQSPEVVKKHKRRRVVPRKPPLSPRPTGESCQPGNQVPVFSPQLLCARGHHVLSLLRVDFSLFSFFLEHCSHSCLLPTTSIPLPGYLLCIPLGSSF